MSLKFALEKKALSEWLLVKKLVVPLTPYLGPL